MYRILRVLCCPLFQGPDALVCYLLFQVMALSTPLSLAYLSAALWRDMACLFILLAAVFTTSQTICMRRLFESIRSWTCRTYRSTLSWMCRCSECHYGDIDQDLNGDGRWLVEWYTVPCNVGNSSFQYSIVDQNDFYLRFVISNTRWAAIISICITIWWQVEKVDRRSQHLSPSLQ